MTKRMALISWGRSFDKTYLAVPIEKVGVLMDAFAHGQVVVASDYRVEEKTTFEPDKYGTDVGLAIVDASRLEPPTPEEEEAAETEAAEKDDAAADAAAASSDLEARIAEVRDPNSPPAELS